MTPSNPYAVTALQADANATLGGGLDARTIVSCALALADVADVV